MMQAKRTLTLLPLTLVPLIAVSVAPAAVQDEAAREAATEALPSARSVIDRFAEVTNMSGLVEKTKSYKATGKIAVEAMGMEGAFTSYAAKPSMTLQVFDLGMGESSMGFDGETAWMIQPMMGELILDGESRIGVIASASYDAGLMPAKMYDKLEVVGKETFEGEECFKLHSVYKAPEDEKLAKKSLKVRTQDSWYSVESGLLVGREGTQAAPTGSMVMRTVMSDYKKFGDYMHPSKTMVEQMGMEIMVTIDAVEYDKVEREMFNLPLAIAAQLEPEEIEEIEEEDA